MDDEARPPTARSADADPAARPGHQPARERRRAYKRWRGPEVAPAARATILDLDRRGFAIPPGDGIAVDAMLLVDLPRLGVRQARVVRDGGSHFRCDWATPLSDGELAGLVPGRLDAAMLARPAPGYAEPDIARFPAIVRAGTVVGIALLLWLLIYTARRA